MTMTENDVQELAALFQKTKELGVDASISLSAFEEDDWIDAAIDAEEYEIEKANNILQFNGNDLSYTTVTDSTTNIKVDMSPAMLRQNEYTLPDNTKISFSMDGETYELDPNTGVVQKIVFEEDEEVELKEYRPSKKKRKLYL